MDRKDEDIIKTLKLVDETTDLDVALTMDNGILHIAGVPLVGGGGSSPDAASFYLGTGGLTGISNTALTLVINETQLNTDPTKFALALNQVTVTNAGNYEINIDAYINNSSTSRTEYTIWLEKNGAEVPGTRTGIYQRGYDSGSTGSINVSLALAASDVLRVRVQRTDGGSTAGYQDDNGTRFNIKEL